MTSLVPTLGVILAGGLARRMGGGDKPLLKLDGKPLVSHVAERLQPQCSHLILNANGDPSRYTAIDVPVVPDPLPNCPGPLAGVLAAMDWCAENNPGIRWIVSVPGDTPLIPDDLVARLHETRSAAQTPLACATSGGREHYTVSLWSIHLREDLRRALTSEGEHRVGGWAKAQGLTTADWPDEPLDPFFNINTPEDLNAAHTMLSSVQRFSRTL